MTAIDAIDEDMKIAPPLRAEPSALPDVSSEASSAMAGEQVRELLRSASAVLSDSAETLYSAELEGLRGDIDTQDPDDDRAAGRLDYARLDLMSE